MVSASGNMVYGKVDVLGGAYVTTCFWYYCFLPVVPRTSYLVVTGPGERALTLPLVARSVLAGYARIWALVVAGLVVAGMVLIDAVSASVAVPIGLATGMVAIWSWASLGRLSADERAQREAYALFAGAPVDVALIARAMSGQDAAEAGEWLDDVRRRAEETIAAEGVDLAPSYRGLGCHTDWHSVAERAHAATPACQRAALTLARLAWAESEGPARLDAASVHARIWSSIRAQDQAVLHLKAARNHQ